MSNKPRVFLSYARTDGVRVKKLYDHLENEGFRPWMDDEQIPGGSLWWEKIQEAIKQADFLFICLSQHFVTRLSEREDNYLKKEVNFALKKYKALHAEQKRLHTLTMERLNELPKQSAVLSKADLKAKLKRLTSDVQSENDITFVIPIRFEACDMPKRLMGFQWVELSSPKDLSRLLKMMRKEVKNRKRRIKG
jgi:hypothetical protein